MSEPPKPAVPVSSKELLAEKLRQERAKIKASVLRTTQSEAISEADRTAALAALQASRVGSVAEAVRSVTPLTDALPQAAMLATGAAPIEYSLVQAEDVKKFKRRPPPIKAPDWNARMREIAATRQPGHPLQPILERIVGYVYAQFSITKEAVRKTYKEIANACGVCADTVYRSMKFWRETSGVIDVQRVMGWEEIEVNGQERTLLVRQKNAYVPRLPDELDAETEKAAPEIRPLRRVEAQKQRWAHWFDLALRPWGLNTTPLKTRRTQGELAPS